MADFLAPAALLPDGWAERVRLSVDDGGTLTAVLPAAGRGASGVSGPAAASGGSGATRLPGVVVPGVPNAHSHAFQRGMAGRAERAVADGASFWSWRDRMYAFAARLDPDHVEAIATQLYVEMLEAGYTSVAEFHYLHHRPDGGPYADPAEMSMRLFAAAARAGIGITLLPALYRAGGFGRRAQPEQRRFVADVDGLCRLLEAAARTAAGDPARSVGLALHSLRAVPAEDMGPALVAAERIAPGGPVHIHVAEQAREVEECVAWSGARPVEWLLDHAPVSARWCLVHATHATAAELARVSRTGAVIGLCPTTEANLGDGLFPLPAHLDAGGRLAIGSDSHVSVSAIEELRWLEYGQRLSRAERTVAAGRPHASNGRTLLDHAWRGGAAAVGRQVGVLAAGARADWVVLDADHPALAARSGDALLDGWIFAADGGAVREVWVGGRRVVAGGRHDARDDVRARYGQVLRRLAR